MAFKRKLNRRNIVNIGSGKSAEVLFDTLENLRQRISHLEALWNAQLAATTPLVATADAIHESPDYENIVTVADFSDPAATDLGGAMNLANRVKALYELHRGDSAGTGDGAHDAKDATNTISAADATDLSTLITLVTELLTVYTAHIANGTAHTNADAINSLASVAAPTTLAECVTRLVDLRTKYNAHVGMSLGVASADGIYDNLLG